MKTFQKIILLIVMISISCSQQSEKHEFAYFQIEALTKMISVFKKDVGRYPSNSEGLEVLLINKGDIKNWNGPYLNKPIIPVDHWGNEYIYIYPARNGNLEYDLYSRGKNGIDDCGRNDDISNWAKYDKKLYQSKDVNLFKRLWNQITNFVR